MLKHLLGSGLGLILAIFGTFALGAYLAKGSAGRLGLVAMVITVLGYALFLMPMGVSTFAAPEEGQAYLAGIEEFAEIAASGFAVVAQTWTLVLAAVLLLVGNVLLGVAVWRSGVLPRWAGVLWAAAAVVMYPLGLVYAMTTGARSTPPTVLLVGALLLVIGGGWMAWSVMRKPSRQLVRGPDVQPGYSDPCRANFHEFRTPEARFSRTLLLGIPVNRVNLSPDALVATRSAGVRTKILRISQK